MMDLLKQLLSCTLDAGRIKRHPVDIMAKEKEKSMEEKIGVILYKYTYYTEDSGDLTDTTFKKVVRYSTLSGDSFYFRVVQNGIGNIYGLDQEVESCDLQREGYTLEKI